VFAAARGGRSIHSNCSRPWISATNASTSGTSPDCWQLPSPPWPGCSTALVSGDCEISSPNLQFSATSAKRQATWSTSTSRSWLASARSVTALLATGSRQQGRSAGVGYDRVHVAIDDTTRLAYVEVLADEQKATAIGFLSRAVAWFNGHGMECRQVMIE
jgi:hypothetical protein